MGLKEGDDSMEADREVCISEGQRQEGQEY